MIFILVGGLFFPNRSDRYFLVPKCPHSLRMAVEQKKKPDHMQEESECSLIDYSVCYNEKGIKILVPQAVQSLPYILPTKKEVS